MGLEKINILRKQKGLSIDELSKLSGVPVGTLSKITAGITKNPNLETVKAIANALGCSLDDFDDIQKEVSENKSNIETIAAHFKDRNISEEKLKRIEKFIEFTLNEDD